VIKCLNKVIKGNHIFKRMIIVGA